MHIQVFGSGCTKCKKLHETVTRVVADLGIKETVEYSNDVSALAELGAKSSPAFVLDGKIISAGTVPSRDEIKEALMTQSTHSKQKEVCNKACCGCGCSCAGNCC